eukprot:scaffold230752_cov28-Tisochrysis_lutea.AAC.4
MAGWRGSTTSGLSATSCEATVTRVTDDVAIGEPAAAVTRGGAATARFPIRRIPIAAAAPPRESLSATTWALGTETCRTIRRSVRSSMRSSPCRIIAGTKLPLNCTVNFPKVAALVSRAELGDVIACRMQVGASLKRTSRISSKYKLCNSSRSAGAILASPRSRWSSSVEPGARAARGRAPSDSAAVAADEWAEDEGCASSAAPNCARERARVRAPAPAELTPKAPVDRQAVMSDDSPSAPVPSSPSNVASTASVISSSLEPSSTSRASPSPRLLARDTAAGSAGVVRMSPPSRRRSAEQAQTAVSH